MPSVMIRRNDAGQLTFYIAKKDQEEIVVSLEHDSPELWGGEVTLGDGSSYFIEPIPQPKLPITVRAKRAGEA
ncbi:nitrogen fixation protein NifT [Azotobacter beijerinckii]|jgi:nitrogen fixation protein NifT|uniref:Nitrogen fixation protein n=3 Tax=Azotobacter TaxID=352 RepID=A0A0C4WFT3_9GAMM|nr:MULTISPECIES: putative nitrogen fixation protein NifT [Azotobacter]AJE19643.1 Nitrogen fixation protein [Azotobacter chroococcum NCIMB 8003]ASL24957.1 protein NifT [Azotobacter chroococcum]MDV7211144.1 putative nitrogen fixation protein NifT [Azotobacter beijerinckii]QQE88921.1 putative nitrogen fixation protein NifT [Azotobacter chroococcum]TBV98164.1 putative nitrogen fixation protein NifT [Azotobacter chroococcum]